MPYLIVLEPGNKNWSAYAPDLPGVITTGKDADDTTERMREAIATHLYELQQDGDEIPAAVSTPETQAVDSGDVLRMIDPAPVNPVSMEVERLLKDAGLSQAEVARRLGTSRAAVSRLADPFHWGHSLATLRRLGEVLGKPNVKVTFKRASRGQHRSKRVNYSDVYTRVTSTPCEVMAAAD